MTGIQARARLGHVILFLVLGASLTAAARAEETEPPQDLQRLEVGGLLFGDTYWVASHHDPTAEGIVSAWIRRGYLTFDSELTRRLSGRMRFELNQDGAFDVFEFEVDFKDLYLQTAIGEHRVLFGLSPTPTFNLIESFWGYRHVERTPLDLQGIASRDTGIAANGPIARDGSITYRVMHGSQIEFGSDSSDSGKWMGAVSFESNRHWTIELYADFEAISRQGNDRRTLQTFIGYKTDSSRFGLQYSNQDRGADPGLEIASFFAISDFAEHWSFLSRIDRLFEPSIRGEDIAYLPFDPDATATLLILGVEARPFEFFSLVPNIEYIGYDDPAGAEPKPEHDLLVRLTVYLTF